GKAALANARQHETRSGTTARQVIVPKRLRALSHRRVFARTASPRSLHPAADVRAAAAILTIGLLAGSAFGLLLSDVPRIAGQMLLVACGITALYGWWTVRPHLLTASVVSAFFVGGAI